MSPCKNDCGSGEAGLSWLDGDDTCARCRPEMPREPIPYLHQGRPPLVPLREMAAIDRDNPFRPPAVAVEPLTPVPAGAETPETISEAQRAVRPRGLLSRRTVLGVRRDLPQVRPPTHHRMRTSDWTNQPPDSA